MKELKALELKIKDRMDSELFDMSKGVSSLPQEQSALLLERLGAVLSAIGSANRNIPDKVIGDLGEFSEDSDITSIRRNLRDLNEIHRMESNIAALRRERGTNWLKIASKNIGMISFLVIVHYGISAALSTYFGVNVPKSKELFEICLTLMPIAVISDALTSGYVNYSVPRLFKIQAVEDEGDGIKKYLLNPLRILMVIASAILMYYSAAVLIGKDGVYLVPPILFSLLALASEAVSQKLKTRDFILHGLEQRVSEIKRMVG